MVSYNVGSALNGRLEQVLLHYADADVVVLQGT